MFHDLGDPLYIRYLYFEQLDAMNDAIELIKRKKYTAAIHVLQHYQDSAEEQYIEVYDPDHIYLID